MRKLSILLLSLLLFSGCKKDTQNGTPQTLTIKVTNISTQTTFNFQLQGAGVGNPPDFQLENSSTNGTYTISATSGQTLNVSWTFTTQGNQYGQGNIAILDGSQTLLNINGGYSISNNTIVVP